MVIYQVEAISPYYSRVDQAMRAQFLDDFCYSEMTRLECLTLPMRTGNATLTKSFDTFFAQNLRLDIDIAVFELATKYRALHGLKTPDAIHVATAIHHGCAECWTNDLRLARATTALTFRTF